MISKLSLLVVNYRSEDALEHCLRSVHSATRHSVEVVLVDNSIGRGADDILRASGLSGQYFAQSKNQGYTRAANFGATQATGEFLCFLNPDTVLDRHCLDRMVEWVEQHPHSVVGPRELNEREKIITTAFPFVSRRYIWGANLLYRLPWPTWIQPWLAWLIPPYRYARLCRTANEPKRVPVLSGSCLVMSRRTYDRVGPWAEHLTYFGLESEWFKRARDQGVLAWYLPAAAMYHEHGLSIHRSRDGHVREEAVANRRWHARQLGLVAVIVLAVILWLEYRMRPSRRSQ